MTSGPLYVVPPEPMSWTIQAPQDTLFSWEYDGGRTELLALYEKGKRQQWNAQDRIDWTRDLDPDNPMQIPEWALALHGSDLWNKLTRAQRNNVQRHAQAWQISQFLHGEQGALICAAKIVQQVADIDAKFYAATQVIDEARHVEAFSRLLHEKFRLVFPADAQLKALLEDVIAQKDWDFTYLGMQVIIEGLALAAFQGIRDIAQNPLARQVNAYVMQDEARHVAFGRMVLRDFYRQISDVERSRREEFVVEACYLMRDRLTPSDAWAAAGLDPKDCLPIYQASEGTKTFRSFLFSRIVPTVKDLGLWGPRIREAYDAMGIIGYANVDAEAILAADARIAEEFDAGQFVSAALNVKSATN
jgi:hypothetical protein